MGDIRTKQNFFDTVTLHVGNKPGPLTEDIERKTMGVLKVINKYATSPEMKKLENVMPHNIKELFCPQAQVPPPAKPPPRPASDLYLHHPVGVSSSQLHVSHSRE